MSRLKPPRRAIATAVIILLVVAVVAVAVANGVFEKEEPIPSFRAQACGLPGEYLERTRHGYFEARSGQISLVPHEPAYMATGGGGWSHSGPWPYLQDIPIVFYGPGIIPKTGDIDRENVTMADVAPTLATLMKGSFNTADGHPLDEVATISARGLKRPAPRLILTIVWDGGGWNVLHHWGEGAWPNLRRIMHEGVTFTKATDGSNPSVTPAVHTTLGTGEWPWHHGITGVPVRDESGEVVDSFLKGESGRFIQVETLAESWDEAHDNNAKVGMVGYEPWHLGMIGQGAERSGGDKDDAAWLNIDTNDWITNPDHYRLPPELAAAPGLERDLKELDAADGKVDDAWRDQAILDQQDRLEETPAWIEYHTRGMIDMIKEENYGADKVTDLLFTNYKQIDRVGHYFNMDSELVRDSLVQTDAELAVIEAALDRYVGRGKWAVVITADHGQQPRAEDVDGYGIDPRAIEADIVAEFGDIVRAVWPTEVFLLGDKMRELGVSVDDVARFLGGYTLADNAADPRQQIAGTGGFDPKDRLFDMAIPATMLKTIDCGTSPQPEPSGG